MPLTEREMLCRERILSEDYADYILETGALLESLQTVLQEGCAQSLGGRFQMLHSPQQNPFNYYSIPKLYGLMQENGAEAANAIRLQQQPVLQLRGQNTLIGIVDTGIDYRLPAFQTRGGQTRIVRIWDQTIQSDTVPAGFSYGTEYTEERINAALQAENPLEIVPSVDTSGHGTSLAGIAAGTEDAAADFIGVVPEARIAVVKLKQAKQYLKDYYRIKEGAEAYQETDIMLGVRYLAELAQKLLRPIVIIIGLGTNQGDHSGRLPLSRVLDYYGTFGGFGIVTAAGNEGDRQHHYAGRLRPEEAYEEVEINVAQNERGFTIELWGTAPDLFSVGFAAPSGEVISRIPLGSGMEQQFQFLLEPTRIFVFNVVAEVQTGNQLIRIRFVDPTAGIWRIRVYGSNLVNQSFHMWLPITEFLQPDTVFLRPAPEITITEPGNAQNPLTVSGFNTLQNSLYPASGRGYTVTGMIKPEITAPAVQLQAPRRGGGYEAVTGTSAAAAVTAGVLAQLFQWGIVQGNQPTMRTVDAKNYMIRGAIRSESMQYPNQMIGWGRLDAYGAFEVLIRT